jgi:ABC-2 type transport system permease protein
MLNIPLFKQSFKSTRVLWFGTTFAMAGMLAQFVFLDFGPMLNMMFYNMTAIVFSGIYVMVSANKLIAVQVDRGSMAYVLCNPIKRSTIALTQLSLLVVTVTMSYSATTMAHLISAAIKDTGDTVAQIFQLNLGACLTTLVIGGICYMASCIFNLSRYSLGLGGGITAVSFVFYFVSMFSMIGPEGMKVLKYFTFLTLYDVESITSNRCDWIWKFCVLAVIAIGTFAAGVVTFNKKDLPL